MIWHVGGCLLFLFVFGLTVYWQWAKRREKADFIAAIKRVQEWPKDTPVIAAVLMEKNEGKIATRLLDSIQPVVQVVFLLDTGSTDDTVAQHRKWCRTQKIPFFFAIDPFRNFEHSRSMSVSKARAAFLAANIRVDYLLLMDADMRLQIKPEFNPKQLTLEGYELQQRTQSADSMWWWNTRILKNDRDWRAETVTHEYWDGAPANLLHDLWILDLDDGGCKADKFERDIRLFDHDCVRNTPFIKPGRRARNYFYRSNSQRVIDYDYAAIVGYAHRIHLQHFPDEIFFSHVYRAECFKKQLKSGTAQAAWIQAWLLQPSRIEPLRQLCQFLLDSFQQGPAASLAIFLALGVQQPVLGLFIETADYRWRVQQVISIACYYGPPRLRAYGLAALQFLLDSPAVSDEVKQQARTNLELYQHQPVVAPDLAGTQPLPPFEWKYGNGLPPNSSARDYLACIRECDVALQSHEQAPANREYIFALHYLKGECFRHLKYPKQAIAEWLVGWIACPTRLESLKQTTQTFLDLRQYRLAWQIAQLALGGWDPEESFPLSSVQPSVTYPSSFLWTTFKDQGTYDFFFVQALSIAGNYLGGVEKQLGLRAITCLESLTLSYPQVAKQAARNRAFYT